MKAHEQRVVNEKHELDERIGKLEKFLPSDVCMSLSLDDRSLLVQQLNVMNEYSAILGHRIALFPKD